MERRLDGAGAERMLFHTSWPLFVTSLTADGRRVLVNDYGRMQGRMRLVNLDGDTASTELAADPGNEFYEHVGMISPDGQWLAYVSNRTHREEVFVRSLTGLGGRWQVSAGGGAAPRWGRDSHELFFVTQGSDIVKRVTLRAQGNDIVVGQPEDLFVAPEAVFEAAYRDFAYDRSHDRFLATRPISEQKDRREIALSLGWVSRMAQARANTARSH